MRALVKSSPPNDLVTNYRLWLDEYLIARGEGRDVTSRWTRITSDLAVETDKLCCYCESKVLSVSYAHVEHLLPKAKFPTLAYDWPNLGFACQVCNTKKGDYYEADAPLINPYTSDPDLHFAWFGPMVFHRDGSDVGAESIFRIKLDRDDLILERAARLQSINSQLSTWSSASGASKRLARDILIEDAQHV